MNAISSSGKSQSGPICDSDVVARTTANISMTPNPHNPNNIFAFAQMFFNKSNIVHTKNSLTARKMPKFMVEEVPDNMSKMQLSLSSQIMKNQLIRKDEDENVFIKDAIRQTQQSINLKNMKKK